MSGKGRKSWREEAPRSEGRQDRRQEGELEGHLSRDAEAHGLFVAVSTLTGGGAGGWIKKAGSRDWIGEFVPSFSQWGTHRS